MPKGDKYIDLTNYLKSNKGNNAKLAFQEIEIILGFKLPLLQDRIESGGQMIIPIHRL